MGNFIIKKSAIDALCPNAKWAFAPDFERIIWQDAEQTEPTTAEIDAHILATKYQRDRAEQFPELKEQLDLLFHDFTAGKGTKSGEWYKKIAKVKSDNPKG